ncbi:hypothetical protein BH20ACI1_BH20ACI1_30650 [soil metagenome]
MTITIDLPSEVEIALQKKAMADGKDVRNYIEDSLRKLALQPSLDEILAPFRREVAESGISDDELDVLVEEAREEIYQEKLAKERE